MPAPSSTGVSALAPAGAATAVTGVGDARQQAFQRALAGELGKSMTGQVLARLADGSAVVRVADIAARMLLPADAQPGTEVPLRLVALTPRPTFAVGAAATLAEASPLAPGAWTEPGAAAALRTGAAGLRALYAGGALPEGGATAQLATGPGATLSATGQVLGSVLAAVLRMERPARAVAARAPLLAAPATDAAALAGALRQGLEQSGLFYEAHVAAWARGERPLATLSAEPQMTARPATPSDPDAAQLINLQLGAREQQQLAWQGQLWPGQPLHWEIGRDSPRRDNGQEQEAPSWHSRLRLRFPALGELEATLALHGNQVALRLAPAGADAARLLRAHSADLAGALAATGTALVSLHIDAGGSDA